MFYIIPNKREMKGEQVSMGRTLDKAEKEERAIRKQKISKMGKRVKKTRVNAGLTQTQLAEKSGVSYQALSYIETGRREPLCLNLQSIADVLNVTADYLMTGRMTHSDYVVLTDKLRRMNPEQLQAVMALVDTMVD